MIELSKLHLHRGSKFGKVTAFIPMSDIWQKCISKSGTLRGVAIACTDLAKALGDTHKLTGEPAQAFGEALVAGFILSSYCKAGERMNLNIKGDGGAKQAL